MLGWENLQQLLEEQELPARPAAAAELKQPHFMLVRTIAGMARGRERVRRKREGRRRW